MSQEETIVLMAVGDIMLGNHPTRIGHGVGSKVRKTGATYLFSQVARTLASADIVFGNLEAVLSSNNIETKRVESVSMRAMPEAVEGLTYAGFNILSLANNHILQHGQEALFETVSILSKNNIKYVGVSTDITKAREPQIVAVKDIILAFLAYCLIPDKTAYISVDDAEEICADVSKAKSQADILIVSLHWGSEYIQSPSPSQVRLAHQIIDSGANIILGHHPHVLQGIEIYRKGLICYSLGNFIFDLTYLEETRNSMILECQISKEGLISYKLIPIYSDDQYVPYLLQGEGREALLMKLDKLSSELKDDSLVSYEEKEQEYKRQVDILRKRASRRMMRYFASNIYRYSPRFVLQIFADYLKRHLQ
jgi:poly-gamma-glutamate synthesis protein (capsule biosynthesis protein)